MNKFFATLFFTFVLAFNTTAQVQYETSNDLQNGLKTLKGILSIDVLKNDSAFAWMRNDISWYKPNNAAVSVMKEVKDTVQLMVFIGYTFFGRKFWGKRYNPASKQLMLDHAFQLVNTVKFHIGAGNIRSQIAIGRVGVVKTKEVIVAYHGEPDRHNFEYELKKEDWEKK